jgi:hypothetical protein
MPYRKLKAALAEAYKTLDFIHKPHDMIFEYFPPEGRAPQ